MKKMSLNSGKSRFLSGMVFLSFCLLLSSCSKKEEAVEPEEDKMGKQEAEAALTAGNSQSWNLEELKIEGVIYQGQNFINAIPQEEIAKAEDAAKTELGGNLTFISVGKIYQTKDQNNVVTETGTWAISDDVAKLTLTPDDIKKNPRTFDINVLTQTDLKVYYNYPYDVDVNNDNMIEKVTLKVMLRLAP